MLLTLGLCGGLLIFFTMEYLEQVEHVDLATTPTAINQVGLLLLVVTMMAGIPAVGMGAYLMYLGSRIMATRQWPPAGMGFRGQEPVRLESRTNVVGITVMMLGAMLIIGGLMLPILGWRLLTVLSP